MVGPRGDKAASVFTSSGDNLSLFSLEISGTFDDQPFEFSKTYGRKSALSALTCTQHFEGDNAIVDITLVGGLVPPK